MIVATTHLYIEVGLKSWSAKRTALASVHHIYVIYIYIYYILIITSIIIVIAIVIVITT